MPSDPDFVAYPSRSRILLIILGAAIFIVIGGWLAGIAGPVPGTRLYPPFLAVTVGWASILFFAVCLIAGVRRLFETDEEVRIGVEGIRARRWSDQTIPWSEITDVTIWTHQKTRTIVLHLRDPALFPRRGRRAKLAGLTRNLIGGDVAVSLVGTDRSVDEARAAIAAFRAQWRSRRN